MFGREVKLPIDIIFGGGSPPGKNHYGLQWDLSNPDTLGTISGVHLMEES